MMRPLLVTFGLLAMLLSCATEPDSFNPTGNPQKQTENTDNYNDGEKTNTSTSIGNPNVIDFDPDKVRAVTLRPGYVRVEAGDGFLLVSKGGSQTLIDIYRLVANQDPIFIEERRAPQFKVEMAADDGDQVLLVAPIQPQTVLLTDISGDHTVHPFSETAPSEALLAFLEAREQRLVERFGSLGAFLMSAEGSSLPAYGQAIGNEFEQLCPQGMGVLGLNLRYETSIQGLQLICGRPDWQSVRDLVITGNSLDLPGAPGAFITDICPKDAGLGQSFITELSLRFDAPSPAARLRGLQIRCAHAQTDEANQLTISPNLLYGDCIGPSLNPDETNPNQPELCHSVASDLYVNQTMGQNQSILTGIHGFQDSAIRQLQIFIKSLN